MAKVVVGVEVKAEGLDKAGQSVGSFKKQLREATADLVNMSEKFGVASKEAQNAAMKVAGLKDAIGDAKALAETFNPDKKFVALGGAIQGVTAGFSAFSGAMGLVGIKSEETEKLLLQVQSAMALQQGLSGIAGAMDSFKMLGNTIKGSVVKAFSTLKGAIIGTGIGALVIGIGLLIANFDAVKKAVLNFIPGLAKVGELVSNIVDWFTDLIGVTSEAQRAQEKYIKSVEKGIQRQQDLLDSDAGKYDDYTKKKIQAKIDYNKKVVELDKDETRSAAEKSELLKRYAEKLNAEILQADKDRNKKQEDNQKEADNKAKASQDKRIADNAEANKKKDEQNEKEKEGVKSLFADKLAGLRAEDDAERQSFENKQELSEQERQLLIDNQEKLLQKKVELAELALLKDPNNIDKRIAKINADTELELFAIKDADEKKKILAINAANEIKQVKKDAAVKEKEELAQQAELDLLNDPNNIDLKIAKINADLEKELVALEEGDIRRKLLAKKGADEISNLKKDAAATDLALQKSSLQQQLDAYGAAAGALSNLVGRETAAGKAFAIAEATINVFKAGLQVFAKSAPGPPPVSLGIKIASMVAAIATGIVTVKKIVSTKVPGSGGGGSAPSMPSMPAAPLIPQGQTTRLDQESINAVGSAANRSYVLETDVSSNQERIRRLNRASRIN